MQRRLYKTKACYCNSNNAKYTNQNRKCTNRTKQIYCNSNNVPKHVCYKHVWMDGLRPSRLCCPGHKIISHDYVLKKVFKFYTGPREEESLEVGPWARVHGSALICSCMHIVNTLPAAIVRVAEG